jgi:hypothetical protein
LAILEYLEKFPRKQIWEHPLDLEEPSLMAPLYGLSLQDTNLNHSGILNITMPMSYHACH